jgi:hypothetical protein
VPSIVFTKGGGLWLESIAAIGSDAVGLDWTMDIGRARALVGDKVALQGNLDPNVLFAPPDAVANETRRVLDAFGPHAGHVFNLGHGIAARVRPARGPSPLVRCLTAQLVAFARSATGRPPDPRLATAHDGAAVMAVIDAARSSAAADGRPITPLQET